MDINVIKVELSSILPLRNLFLAENKFQIRYNAVHQRGWSDSYLIVNGDEEIGYASVKGRNDHKDRDSIFEFFLLPLYRTKASVIFSELLNKSKADFIDSQSNETLLTSMLHEFSGEVKKDVVLFGDGVATHLIVPHVNFRKRKEGDKIFNHTSEPVGDYVLEKDGEAVATGGFLLHYNQPFCDLYMEVRPDQRKKGYGSFLLQEIKKASFNSGHIPAARCDISNEASKATLLKAGMKMVGYVLAGKLKKN